jgi:hypothetical protein
MRAKIASLSWSRSSRSTYKVVLGRVLMRGKLRIQLARQGAAPEFRREAIEGLKAAVEGAVHSPRYRARPDCPGIPSRGPKGRVVHVCVTGPGRYL